MVARVPSPKTKRTNNVMVRLSSPELEAVLAAKPDDVPLAVYLRERITRSADLRLVAAFIVAALSPDLTLEATLKLFDETMGGLGHECD
jgi:hypothetical protein